MFRFRLTIVHFSCLVYVLFMFAAFCQPFIKQTFYHTCTMHFSSDCCCVHCIQSALKNMEDECTHLQMMYRSSQEELEQLVERSEEHIQEIRELNDKCQVCLSLNFSGYVLVIISMH